MVSRLLAFGDHDRAMGGSGRRVANCVEVIMSIEDDGARFCVWLFCLFVLVWWVFA